jgi:DNA-binding FrmR family transcriptional regulator
MENKKVINRLNRIEGQIRGITRMIEEDRACKDVVVQLSAVKAGVDKILNILVSENLLSCIAGEEEAVQREKIEEALELIYKMK